MTKVNHFPSISSNLKVPTYHWNAPKTLANVESGAKLPSTT